MAAAAPPNAVVDFVSRYAPLAQWRTSMIGVEHEYAVHRGGRRADFRSIAAAATSRLVSGLDPGDLSARRTASGLAVTADGLEAEIATPPLPLRSGFTVELDRWVRQAHHELASMCRRCDRAFGNRFHLRGYSTHVSISTADASGHDVALLVAQVFGFALVLLSDDADGVGIWVRPRPGRTEICTKFVHGRDLTALAVFAAAATKACTAALAGEGPPLDDLRVRTSLRPATQRFGWFVDGRDLCTHGRRAVLQRPDGQFVLAQTYLERVWASVRPIIAAETSPADVAVTDAVVAGRRRLRLEQPASEAASLPRRPPPRDSAVASVFGDSLRPRTCKAYQLSPVLTTWAMTVFEVRLATRRLYACVPAPALQQLLDDVDRGRLDGLFEALGEKPPSAAPTVLRSWTDAQRPGLWDELGPAASLIPPEIPVTTSPSSPGATTDSAFPPSDMRPGKPGVEAESPGPRHQRHRRHKALLLAAAAVLVAAVGGAVTFTLVSRGGRGATSAVPVASPVATARNGCGFSLAFPSQGWDSAGRELPSCHLAPRPFDVSIDADDGSFSWHARIDASPTVQANEEGELDVNFFAGVSSEADFFHVTVTQNQAPSAACACISYRQFVSDWGNYPEQRVTAARVVFDDGITRSLSEDGGRWYTQVPAGANAVVHLEVDFMTGDSTKTLNWP